jgi:hypothetical protein
MFFKKFKISTAYSKVTFIPSALSIFLSLLRV